MRKRGKPALGQGSDGWSAPAEESTSAGSEQENRLEDDGLVFWPHDLGQPEGPRLVQIGPRAPRPPQEPQARPRRRRTVTTLFVLLFFAGAALTAAAGNEVATIVASGTPSADSSAVDETTTGTTETATTSDGTAPTTTETAPASEPSEPTTTTATEPVETTTTTTTEPVETTTSAEPETTTTEPAVDSPTSETPQPSSGASEPGAVTTGEPEAASSATAADRAAQVKSASPQPVLAPQQSGHAHRAKAKGKKAELAYSSLGVAPRPDQVEHEATPGQDSGNVRWINEPLPDPTPPSLRLSEQFAHDLRAVSAADGLDWAFLLAVLRAERLGRAGQVALPALEQKAAALAQLHLNRSDRRTLALYKHDRRFTDRVLVLERYYRALGLRALVKGLVASRDRLAARILADPRIEIYPGGREDISTGRMDVRVLAMIAFLGESFGDVRVSCLISGHRLYSRPGVISAHIYGRAVDIAALEEVSIYGHQQSGSVTEKATRQILLLPAEVLPRQVISLIGLGGPSFPLADHTDHIHIGY